MGRRVLAPGGVAWRPGAGHSGPGSRWWLVAAAAGAEGTASGRRAVDSQQPAKGKARSALAGLLPGSCGANPERPGPLKLRSGAWVSVWHPGTSCPAGVRGAWSWVRGWGSGVAADASARLGCPESEATLRSAPLPSSLYCHCLSASSLTSSPDSSFVLPRSPRV